MSISYKMIDHLTHEARSGLTRRWEKSRQLGHKILRSNGVIIFIGPPTELVKRQKLNETIEDMP